MFVKWSNDKSRLIHDKQYVVWSGEDVDLDSYGLSVYLEYDDGDTIFEGSGFYSFDNINDVWRRRWVQPNFFLEIEKPVI